MKYKFTPNFNLRDKVTYDKSLVSEEPMLFGASWEFARKHGGVLTNSVMDKIQDKVMDLSFVQATKGYHPVIDTKTVMLMPGWYPSIPGWHCDGVIRKDQESQPDLSTLDEEVFHFITSMSSDDSCGTEIVTEEVVLDVDESSVWMSVDSEVEKLKPKTFSLENGEIGLISRSTIHRCPKVEERCWRFFFRLSFYHMPVANKIRNQVQVYADINKGW